MRKLVYGICIMLANITIVNAQSKSVTIAGKVLSYNENSGYGCFYVDPEMVKAGVAVGLGSKAVGSKCISEKYGNGVPVSFSGLKKDADYSFVPQEDVLISVTGKWVKKGENYEFQTTEWEPFF